MISKTLEKSLQRAISLARFHGCEYATLEHLLLSLTEDPDALSIIERCGANVHKIRHALLLFIQRYHPRADKNEDPRVTLAFQRVIKFASDLAQAKGSKEIHSIHMLKALYGEEDAYVAYVLSHNGVEPEILDKEKSIPSQQTTSDDMEEDESVLYKYGHVLSLENNLPFIGREEELQRMMQILARRTKNNPLLVGEPGVGKTALVHGFLEASKDIPVLNSMTIYALDLGALLAGARFRGDFEERFQAVCDELKKRYKQPVLFIDEAHALVGSGSVQGGSMDGAGLLKAVLSSQSIQCIAVTTYKEYKQYLEKDQGLLRRFQRMDIKEPTQDMCIRMLKGLKKSYEKHHGVTFSEEAVERAVILTSRHMIGRFLPDKAIDILDEAGSFAVLQQKKRRINTKDVEETIARLTGVPLYHVRRNEKEGLRRLEKRLRDTIFGQDKAIDAVMDAMTLARSGLKDIRKPIGCYVFSGPTGVGKTEIVRQISEASHMPLIRLDMSEYMEKHSVSRLIGAPPGYIGFDQGGILTDAVSKDPYSVVLLDEIEKAHQDIYNLLLQVMDYGYLTDHNGVRVDFRNTLLIMTTNAGASILGKTSLGFTSPRANELEDIKRLFSPEFRNRLDAVISFAPLSSNVMHRIVDKFLNDVQTTLKEKNVQLSFSVKVKTWLAKKGFDPLSGARPLRRVIDASIKKPLAFQLLFGELAKGGKVRIGLTKEETLSFKKVSS